ncbi:MAG TPA: class I SAM-dependent methyltransferase [Chthoniobacterales bacterium]|nr:class I SAM-dependent methyltransferase [Chthoniobacterales bacterium]
MSGFINEAIEQFAHDHTTPESELFDRLRDETRRTMASPQMQIDRIEGQFLKLLVRLTGARRILELGTFTGYSALAMAEGLPDDGRLITCEVDPKAEAIARRYFSESPHGRKIDLRMGPALETIKTLSGPFDLAFIDADKPNYSNYYQACISLVKPGGLVIVDNVLWEGKVTNPQDDNTWAIAACDRLIQSDPRVDNVCLTVRDGIILAWKRP